MQELSYKSNREKDNNSQLSQKRGNRTSRCKYMDINSNETVDSYLDKFCSKRYSNLPSFQDEFSKDQCIIDECRVNSIDFTFLFCIKNISEKTVVVMVFKQRTNPYCEMISKYIKRQAQLQSGQLSDILVELQCSISMQQELLFQLL